MKFLNGLLCAKKSKKKPLKNAENGYCLTTTLPFSNLHWHINLSLPFNPNAFSASVFSDKFSMPSSTSTRHVPQMPEVQPKGNPKFSQAEITLSPSFTSFSFPSKETTPILLPS